MSTTLLSWVFCLPKELALLVVGEYVDQGVNVPLIRICKLSSDSSVLGLVDLFIF